MRVGQKVESNNQQNVPTRRQSDGTNAVERAPNRIEQGAGRDDVSSDAEPVQHYRSAVYFVNLSARFMT